MAEDLARVPHGSRFTKYNLTRKQYLFCRYYIKSGFRDHVNAVVKAGYDTDNPDNVGRSVLSHGKICRYLAHEKAKFEKKFEMGPEEVTRSLGKLAQFDITDLLSWQDGELKLKDSKDLPPEVTYAINSVYQGPHGIKLKTSDKLQTLQTLAKVLGMTSDNIQATQVAFNLNLTPSTELDLVVEADNNEDNESQQG